jgi:TetR/AcrR family transcriptional regulator, transcriptional repressor for nem operon
MRFEKGRKEETRRRVVDVASQRFRRDGIEGTGVAALMADAGLTHGGFYAHFSSKDELVVEALAAALAGSRDILAAEARAARERGADGLEAVLRRYLRAAHRDAPGVGCAVAALASEISRHKAAVRDLLARGIRDYVSIIAAELPAGRSRRAAQDTAYAIFGLMVGTLQLARVTSDPAVSESILRAGRKAALALARDGAGPAEVLKPNA